MDRHDQLGMRSFLMFIVDREREQKGLAKLQTYIIDVVSGNHNLNDSKARIGDSQKPLLMESTADASQLKELKLGSTFIRQWLANRQQDAKSRGYDE